jgi:Protein of unknown function (DUF4232)
VTVEVVPPAQNLTLAHRNPELPRREPGAPGQSASGCTGRSAIFAAPAGSYLALGWHRTKVRGAPAPSVLVLPEGCALPNRGLSRPPLPPGEGLCFAEGAPPCDRSKLTVRAGRTGLAAGTVYQPFEVVNRSGRTCTVSGVPNLVAVDRDGHSIGPPATHEPALSPMTGDHPKVIVLEPGGIATFQTRYE